MADPKRKSKSKGPERAPRKVGGGKRVLAVPVPSVVQSIVGRTGSRGEIIQVKLKLLQGDSQGKVMRRNVKGPVRINDVLMLRETEIEARRIRGKVMKGTFS